MQLILKLHYIVTTTVQPEQFKYDTRG